MAVSNTQPFVEYQANGVATVFSIPFLLIKASDLDVFLNAVEIVSGFTISGVGANTSTITFVAAPAVGTLSLIRNVPLERLTDYQTNGDLLARTINLDFDRVWCALQDLGRLIGRALVRPLGKNYFDANGRQIKNLANAVDPQDAATKSDIQTSTDSLATKEDVDLEAAARRAGDNALQVNIAAETSARVDGDASLQAQITSGAVPAASQFSPISWHDQVIPNSLSIPAGKNAWSFGPSIKIAQGQVVTIADGSYWTIANGRTTGTGTLNAEIPTPIDMGTL